MKTELEITTKPAILGEPLLAVAFIAPYLPYNVFYEYKNDQGNTYRHELNNVGLRTINLNHVNKTMKLCLRPLSLLCTEIEHNGKKFNPLLELAKIHESSYISSFETNSKNNIYGIKYDDIDGFETVFAYHVESKSFGCHTTFDMDFHSVANQYDLFQLLFEWHFDVFGLMDEGLAVAI